MSQKVDEKIIKKVQDLVGEGVRNVREMERHIRIYVKDELFCDSELPSFQICVANLNRNRAHNDYCEVYDSLNSENRKAKVADKVANMLYCRKPEIKKLIKSVQQQRNYVDCEVFAIAFATSLAFGDRPEEVIYDSKIMRQHLLNCLRNMRMERFPVQVSNTIQRCKRKTLVIEVFCSCRQPYYLVMVMCTKCEEWFHVDSEKILKSAIDNEDIDFFCTGCK